MGRSVTKAGALINGGKRETEEEDLAIRLRAYTVYTRKAQAAYCVVHGFCIKNA
jgi:hypothetical protein